MKVYLIGVDIIEVKRIKWAAEKYPNFIKRIYTDNEIKYCESKIKKKFLHYASRFAAKEAVSKSMGKGIGKDISFKDIELNNYKNGQPYVKLYGKTLNSSKKINIKDIKISVSATENYAVAFAMSFTG